MPVAGALFVGAAVYSGAATAIGTAILGATVSTAVATAVGAATLTTGIQLASGEKPEDALKSGIISGLTAGIGGTIGSAVAPGSSELVQQVIGGSITGSAAFALAGADPIKGAVAGAIGSVTSTTYASTVGKFLGATTDAAAKTIGNAAINAGLSGVQAAVTGGNIQKSMLTGAVAGAAIVNAKELTESILGANNVKALESVTNLKESDIHNLFTNALMTGVVAGANNEDVFKAFANNLVSSGLSTSLANAMEVSFRDSFAGREEDLAGIISAVSGITRTAINAELYGDDVGKAIENATPGIILSSFQAYEKTRTAREERESLTAEREKQLQDQLKAINELADAQNAIIEKVKELETQRDSLISQYQTAYAEYEKHLTTYNTVRNLGLSYRMAVGAPSVADYNYAISRINELVPTLESLNTQFVNVEAQITAESQRFDTNKISIETAVTKFNEDLAKFGGLEQFSGQTVATPEQRVNNAIAAKQTEVDAINQEAMQMAYSESQIAALPALPYAASIAGHAALGALLWLANKYKTLFPDDVPAQEKVLQIFLDNNPEVLPEAKKAAPNLTVRTITNPQTNKPELSVVIPDVKDLPEPTQNFIERVNVEVEKPTTEMKDISDAVLQFLIDELTPKPEPPLPKPVPEPPKPPEPPRIDTTVKQEQGKTGTQGAAGAAGGAPSGPSQPAPSLQPAPGRVTQPQTPVPGAPAPAPAPAPTTPTPRQPAAPVTPSPALPSTPSTPSQPSAPSEPSAPISVINPLDPEAQLIADIEKQLQEQIARDIERKAEEERQAIAAGRAERAERARGVRTEREQAQYERDQAKFEQDLKNLEADIAKARSDEEKAQARRVFTTQQRERLRGEGRLTGGLQAQIDAELGNLLDQYEDAQRRAGRAVTQKEGLAAPQQPGDAGRGISDQDVIDFLGLGREEAERYGFFGDTEGVAGGMGPGSAVEGEGPGSAEDGTGPGSGEEGVGPGAGEEGFGPGGGAVDERTRLRPIVIYDQRTGAPRARATAGIPERVTAQAVEGILGDKEPLFGGDEDEQRAVWNRRSLRLRKALGL